MPNYKRIYLKGHYYFITVTTYNRNNILIQNIDLLRKSFECSKQMFEFDIIAIVVLPDHMHLILKPETPADYSKIIGKIKRDFTKALDDEYIDKNISKSRIKRKEKGVWQRRFYEHTIRNEKSFNDLLDYIHFNPVKHGYVQNVKNWKYSSFNKFVNQGSYEPDWGTFNDVKNISEIDLE